MRKFIFFTVFLVLITSVAEAQSKNNFAVIAYYAGNRPLQIDSFPIEKLTHIIFSFCHLKGNRLNVDDAADTIMIQKMVALKKRNPGLKVILSLGGWGGCASCSDVFSNQAARKEFARSVKELSEYFGSDGIDLDWEYPAIEGYPHHKFQPADKEHFTKLVKQLRKTLGRNYQLSFAAGGFNYYIDHAVQWKKVMKKVNYVNLMSYDLVNGYSRKTGHHTALYSTAQQTESIDNAVQKLRAYKVPENKIVIGAAFYGRMWEAVPDTNYGLYQEGRFLKGISYKNFSTQLTGAEGFVYHWDEQAQAPYHFNPREHLFVTYDNERSVQLKTKYAIEKKLGGIMFWELTNDAYSSGLLEAIDAARHQDKK